MKIEIPKEILLEAIAASQKYNRPILFESDGLQVLSERRETYRKDGTRLILSYGPAFHQDRLWVSYYTVEGDEIKWTTIDRG